MQSLLQAHIQQWIVCNYRNSSSINSLFLSLIAPKWIINWELPVIYIFVGLIINTCDPIDTPIDQEIFFFVYQALSFSLSFAKYTDRKCFPTLLFTSSALQFSTYWNLVLIRIANFPNCVLFSQVYEKRLCFLVLASFEVIFFLQWMLWVG